jgi:hypothetical protein
LNQQQDQPADDRPAPGDRDRAAVVPRLPIGGEAAGEDGDDGERDREVREAAPRALEVLLVAELRQPALIVVANLLRLLDLRHRALSFEKVWSSVL